MARPLWSGSLSFGLVNVPVRLVSASKDVDVHFRQLHEKDATPIQTQRWCSEEHEEVAYEELARMFEFDDGDRVVVTDDELDGLAPERTRTIEVQQFVDLADVDPIYFDHPYLVVPAAENEGALRAYRLLFEVMQRSERAALGRFVMRTKEYLAIVRARDGVMALTTMLFHDEVRPISGVDGGGKAKPAKGQLDDALKLIDAMTVDWDPERYEDRYRARLRDLIERKRAGRTIKAPTPVEEPKPVPDLMAALRESLDAARSGTPVRAGGGSGPDDGDGDGDAGLQDLSREELYQRAQEREIPGRSSMSKRELIDALS